MKTTIIRECLSIAKRHLSTHPERKCFMHYAFIIQGNKLVEWAPNRTHDPDKYLGYPDYAKLHAETLAYKRAKGLLKKNQPFEVVNIRLGKSGELRNSMPCPCCARWMRALGCRQLLFSVDAGFAIFPL